MYCPRCGKAQTIDQTRYCSRCGFLMSGIGEFVRYGGQLPPSVPEWDPNSVSPKVRGLKQGGIMFLSGMIVVPLLAIFLAGILDVEPILAGAAAIILFWGGILRMVYALLFQPHVRTSPENAGFFASLRQIFIAPETRTTNTPGALHEPTMSEFPNASMNWRDNDELEYAPRQDNSTSTLR